MGEILINDSRIIVIYSDHPCFEEVKSLISKWKKGQISSGDICIYNSDEINESVYITKVCDTDVEGFYLTGEFKGNISSFSIEKLRKTEKHIDIDKFLDYYSD